MLKVPSILLLLAIMVCRIETQPLILKIKENTPKDKLISDLNQFDQQGSEPPNTKKFNLVLVNLKIKSLFSLKMDGNLYTARLIDLELICNQTDECCQSALEDFCEIMLGVAVSSESMTTPRTFKVIIQIEDENDNSPIFPERKITISIKESDKVESRFKLPLATDLDRKKFSINNYRLVEEQAFPPIFAVEYLRQLQQLNLKLIQKLDREKKSTYRLTVLVIDGGSPENTGKLEVEINVLDVNDNPPRLIRTFYKETLEESMSITKPILRIEAKDDDENENADLYFQIVNENNNDKNYFLIENRTGNIFLKKVLDYERQDEHRFYVEVSNKDSDMERATATVVILVKNLNDERPEISIDYLNTDNNQAVIKETEAQTRFIALATVSDKDKGIGGEVNCKLLNFVDTFEILVKDPSGFPNQYNIKTKVSLDREKKAFYKIFMECEDRGSPIKKSKKEINVRVQDINDNPPVITIAKNITLKENLPKGFIVTKIKASDADEGENSRLTFSILASDEVTLRYLDIDNTSGELRTREVIDRERDLEPLKSLEVQLKVSDRGSPPLSSTISFLVNIEDVNDNSPIFANKVLQYFVTENQPPIHTLGEIPVSDKDESGLQVRLAPSNDGRTYPFVSYSKDKKFFLNTTRRLDWEKEKSFSMKVIAFDGYGHMSHTVTAEIKVNVKDENDNYPIIIFPSQSNFTVPKLSFNEKSGHTVLRVSAMDKDSTETGNGKMSFHIVDHRELLKIDPSTGTIKTSRSMTRSDLGRFEVIVTVRDNGEPPKESSITLFIEVDESKPHSLQDNYKDTEESSLNFSNNNLWKNEGLLFISLIVLLLFLLLCVFIVLYMRHMRGMFPILPDIFPKRKNGDIKGRTAFKGTNSSFKGSHILLDGNVNFQQTTRSQNEKGNQPFYLNQYDSSESNMNCSADHHQSVNPYRQYETMKYHHYTPGNFVTTEIQNGPPFNYDKLFYTSPGKHSDGTIMRLQSNSPNNNNLYDSRPSANPSYTTHNLSICHRIINNIEENPLLQGSFSKESFNERFPSDPALKNDDRERALVDKSAINTPHLRRHTGPLDKIDTYALSYPVEQSTFV